MKVSKTLKNIISILVAASLISVNISQASDFDEIISGSLLTINDTYMDEIEELEVFGETTQDPNNLADIKSVGELYVDKYGNPILNSAGEKQYKIKIISRNKNLLNNKDLVQGVMNYGTVGASGLIHRDSDTRVTLKPENAIPVRPNEKITCKSDKYNFGVAQLSNGTSLGDTGWVQNSITITTGPNTTHIAFNISKGSTPAGNEVFSPDEIMPGDIMLYYGDEEVDFTDCVSNEIELILPYQLQKLGDVYDKMYCDKYSNSFIVKKNIQDLVLDGSENWYMVNGSDPESLNKNNLHFGVCDGFEFTHASKVISDKFIQPANTLLTQDAEGITIRTNNQSVATLYIKVNRSNLSSLNANGFKNWLKDNNVLVKYILKEPKMDRVYFRGNMINVQDGETNLFTQSYNQLQPNIKINVDRLINNAIVEVQKAKDNPTVENIINARALVNLIDNSIIKDSLQSALNDLNAPAELNIEKKKVTANLDLYVKLENTLSLSLDTNYVTFDNFNSSEDNEKQNAFTMSVVSSLPYDIKASISSPIANSDNTEVLSPTILNIKTNDSNTYIPFARVDEEVVIASNNQSDTDNSYGIDLKFSTSSPIKADVYKTSIKVSVEQK